MSISERDEVQAILFGLNDSLLHRFSTHVAMSVQSFHPVAKNAFQGGFFDTLQNATHRPKK
jgi:hypothetical protein